MIAWGISRRTCERLPCSPGTSTTRNITIQVGRKRSSCRKCGKLGHVIREDDIIEVEHEIHEGFANPIV
jgi:hypothetical protein